MRRSSNPRLVRPLVVLLCMLFAAALPAQDAQVRRYGLFVGANDGGRGRVTLRWAVSDAHRVAEVMTEVGGVRPQDSYLLSNPGARDLELQFQHVASRLAADSRLFPRTEIVFYYSGHSDEYGLMLGEDHLSYTDLRRMIDLAGADVSIAILDSCASGAFTRLKGGTFTQPFLVDEGTTVTGHAFLASSSADEASQESDALGSSFFTHYLISGLRGAADTSNDGRVTLDELYHYAREETLLRTLGTFAGPQHASFDFQLSGSGSLVLTDLSDVRSAVVLDRSMAGRLFVSREAGGLVAEVRKHEGRELRIALPAGSYILTLQGEDRNYQHRVHLASDTSVRVGARDFRVTLLDRTRLRGDEPPPVPLSVTIIPGLDLVGEDPYAVTVSLGLLVGRAYRVRGGQASSILSIAHEDLSGVQFSGVGNTVGGDLAGFQGAGVFNVVGGNAHAVQNAGVFNRVEGRGAVLQSAGVFNVSAGGFSGVQAAGVFNMTDATLNGVQAAGVFNRAGAANGAQVSLVNIGGDVSGAQIGLVNIGDRVIGTQIGLVNVSREMYGVPIGLASFVEEGIHNVSIWWEGDERTWIGVQNGSNIFYTLVYGGVERGGRWRELEGLGVGAGIGFRITRRPFYVDFDAGWKRISEGADAEERLAALFDAGRGATFPTARIMVGIAIGDGLGWYMGGSFDAAGPLSNDAMGYFGGRANPIPLSGETVLYPRFFTGLRF